MACLSWQVTLLLTWLLSWLLTQQRRHLNPQQLNPQQQHGRLGLEKGNCQTPPLQQQMQKGQQQEQQGLPLLVHCSSWMQQILHLLMQKKQC
jgi:hypothetical protein